MPEIKLRELHRSESTWETVQRHGRRKAMISDRAGVPRQERYFRRQLLTTHWCGILTRPTHPAGF